MTAQGLLRKAGAASFRVRLLAAMMILVGAITGAALYFAQHSAAAEDERHMRAESQSQLDVRLGKREMRLEAIAERCRRLARSVRIRAALEEGVVEDLYLNAEVELRDLLEGRARFFRFLNASGEPMTHGAPQPWEAQLALPSDALGAQHIGYIRDEEDVLRETIATPIVATDTGEVIGSVVLGFELEEGALWIGGRLHPGMSLGVERVVAAAIGGAKDHSVSVDGAPHLLFVKQLNAGSRFPPAYHVSLFPLAESLARQEAVRWRIVGAAAVVMLAAFLVSHFLSGQLSIPVERLAENAEVELSASEQKYRGIFENAVEGIFQTTPDGHYLQANPALARMYGYDAPGEIIANVADIGGQIYVQADRREEFLRRMREEGRVTDFESEVRCRDGRTIWISENAREVRDERTGEVQHYEGMVLDITERKRATDAVLALNTELQGALQTLQATQEQIIQQERLRALGQMASGIAHDFNNALVPILGYCELLLLNAEALADRERATRYLDTIQTAAKDAASVVSRLREFYRPNKNDRDFAPVNLKRLAEQALTLTKPKWKDQAQANGASVKIVLDLAPVPPVAGEESALREVLTNLIFNAVDAMPTGGTLTLRTRLDGDAVALDIVDTGTGMTEEVRQRCLEPFFSTKGERGTGLGLSMVFGIVQRHSGSLDLQSAVGVGTTFRISLPLMDAATHSSPATTSAEATTRPLRVLVVDDEAPVRDTLGAVLASDGHDVESAVDGSEGLQRFLAGTFDLVITDKAMPGMSGDQMAAAIKRSSPRTPIVLLTGFGLFHDKSEFPGVDVLASKPIRIPALRDAIATALQAA